MVQIGVAVDHSRFDLPVCGCGSTCHALSDSVHFPGASRDVLVHRRSLMRHSALTLQHHGPVVPQGLYYGVYGLASAHAALVRLHLSL